MSKCTACTAAPAAHRLARKQGCCTLPPAHLLLCITKPHIGIQYKFCCKKPGSAFEMAFVQQLYRHHAEPNRALLQSHGGQQHCALHLELANSTTVCLHRREAAQREPPVLTWGVCLSGPCLTSQPPKLGQHIVSSSAMRADPVQSHGIPIVIGSGFFDGRSRFYC